MRTQAISEVESVTVWLERTALGDGESERVPLESFPFLIGRQEQADLAVASSHVSREHASIQQRGSSYYVKDLGSRNGTFVNGVRVTESQLRDGDLLGIANVEFTFGCGGPQASPNSATMVMTAPTERESTRSGGELVGTLRRLQEQLVHRSLEVHFTPIVEAAGRQLFGYEAAAAALAMRENLSPAERLIRATECRLTERINEVSRLVAVEQASRLSDSVHLFLNLTAAEVGVHWLPQSLEKIRDTLAGRQRAVIGVPESAVCDIPYFRSFLAQLRELDMLIAYHGFAGGPGRVAELRPIAPDFLKLAPSLLRGVNRSSGGQRQMQSLIVACHEIGSQVIGSGVQTAVEADIFQELGGNYLQGEHVGIPQPLDELAWKISLARPAGKS